MRGKMTTNDKCVTHLTKQFTEMSTQTDEEMLLWNNYSDEDKASKRPRCEDYETDTSDICSNCVESNKEIKDLTEERNALREEICSAHMELAKLETEKEALTKELAVKREELAHVLDKYRDYT